MGKQAIIALGSNMGDKCENLNKAVWYLNQLPLTSVLQVSAGYETDPVGYDDQDRFLNGAVKVETDLSPEALLGACLGIEAAMGRIRKIKNGPRIIDLDLLLFEDYECDTECLTLPHPRMMERSFVLCPLCDINNDAKYRKKLSELGKKGITPAGSCIIKP